MLIFLIALQSPAASKNWEHVSRLCDRTLRSVCQQTDDRFRVVLVCNQRPVDCFSHPALTVIEEDFPLPKDQSERMADKWLKLKRGLVALHGSGPAHIMITDADDCVHHSLAALAASAEDSAGWNLEVGYMHDAGSRWLYRLKNFDRYCGTSSIVRLEPGDFPRSMERETSDFFILAHGHGVIGDFLRSRGTPLRPLPFIGAIYNSATGENDSRASLRGWGGRKMLLKKLLHSRPLTGAVRREFGLYELPA
jgi:hypothetical protein